MYDVLSQIANLKFLSREGNDYSRRRIFLSQIYFYKVLKVPKDSRDSRDIFLLPKRGFVERETRLAVICVVIDWSNKSNGSDRTDRYF